MDIQRLHQIIMQGVSANTSLLTDFLPGSINYTITRGLAGGLLDLYQKIEQLDSGFFLTSATGESLDNLGNSLGVKRIAGSVGTGYVLAQNTDIKNISIRDNTILTEPLSLEQYIITESNVINIGSYSEERVKIESINLSNDANLKAGTQLISGQYPTVTFTVGSYRSTNGEVSGDIKNAVSSESDLIYRQRIIDTLLKPNNNYFYIKQLLLNLGDINNVLFYTPEAGMVDVWLEPKTQINTVRLSEIQDTLNLELPLGIKSNVKVLTKNSINFKLKVYDFNFDRTKIAYLKDYIIMYLRSLNYRANLVISDLETYLKTKSNIVLEIITPLDKIIYFNEGETFTLNALEVIYNV